jgi:hypothetical protein
MQICWDQAGKSSRLLRSPPKVTTNFKNQMQQSMTDATPMMVQSVTSIIAQPLSTFSTTQYLAALKCLQAWMPYLKGE